MTIYEYMTVWVHWDETIAKVNTHAKNGWRVVSTCAIKDSRGYTATQFTLEREVA